MLRIVADIQLYYSAFQTEVAVTLKAFADNAIALSAVETVSNQWVRSINSSRLI